jgi:hypothetical protein
MSPLFFYPLADNLENAFFGFKWSPEFGGAENTSNVEDGDLLRCVPRAQAT